MPNCGNKEFLFIYFLSHNHNHCHQYICSDFAVCLGNTNKYYVCQKRLKYGQEHVLMVQVCEPMFTYQHLLTLLKHNKHDYVLTTYINGLTTYFTTLLIPTIRMPNTFAVSVKIWWYFGNIYFKFSFETIMLTWVFACDYDDLNSVGCK